MKLLHLLCFLLVLTSCKKNNVKTHLTKITAKTIAVDSSITSSATIDSFVAPYKEKLTSKMEQVLSYTSKVLSGTDGNMQSSLGNLMADLCYEMATKKNNTTIDFAMFNAGGIRANIQKGNITNNSAFKLMPFENELVAVTLTGEKIIELINYFITNKRAHPLSKNIELTISNTNNDYSLKINGKPFDKNSTYTVLTSDYLQNGGDRMNFFKNPEKLTKLNYKVRDAIIDYFKKTDTIKVTIDNRIRIK